jgi:hypothetical protein
LTSLAAFLALLPDEKKEQSLVMTAVLDWFSLGGLSALQIRVLIGFILSACFILTFIWNYYVRKYNQI